jgi:hypothetical protein
MKLIRRFIHGWGFKKRIQGFETNLSEQHLFEINLSEKNLIV